MNGKIKILPDMAGLICLVGFVGLIGFQGARSLADADTLWHKQYGGNDYDLAAQFIPTNDNGFIIVGKTKSMGAGLYDAYLIKTDFAGNILWDKTRFGVKVISRI